MQKIDDFFYKLFLFLVDIFLIFLSLYVSAYSNFSSFQFLCLTINLIVFCNIVFFAANRFVEV